MTVAQLLDKIKDLNPPLDTEIAIYSDVDGWDAHVNTVTFGRPAQEHLMWLNPKTNKYAPLHSEFTSRFATDYTHYTNKQNLIILTDKI